MTKRTFNRRDALRTGAAVSAFAGVTILAVEEDARGARAEAGLLAPADLRAGRRRCGPPVFRGVPQDGRPQGERGRLRADRRQRAGRAPVGGARDRHSARRGPPLRILRPALSLPGPAARRHRRGRAHARPEGRDLRALPARGRLWRQALGRAVRDQSLADARPPGRARAAQARVSADLGRLRRDLPQGPEAAVLRLRHGPRPDRGRDRQHHAGLLVLRRQDLRRRAARRRSTTTATSRASPSSTTCTTSTRSSPRAWSATATPPGTTRPISPARSRSSTTRPASTPICRPRTPS